MCLKFLMPVIHQKVREDALWSANIIASLRRTERLALKMRLTNLSDFSDFPKTSQNGSSEEKRRFQSFDFLEWYDRAGKANSSNLSFVFHLIYMSICICICICICLIMIDSWKEASSYQSLQSLEEPPQCSFYGHSPQSVSLVTYPSIFFYNFIFLWPPFPIGVLGHIYYYF